MRCDAGADAPGRACNATVCAQVRDLLSFERILLLHSTLRKDVPVIDITFDSALILALTQDGTILRWSWKSEGAYKEGEEA